MLFAMWGREGCVFCGVESSESRGGKGWGFNVFDNKSTHLISTEGILLLCVLLLW